MKDKTLFPLPPAIGNLTSKQQRVMEMLQARPNGMRALDIGVALHLEDGCGYCNPGRACRFAHPNATRILDSLRGSPNDPKARRLVVRRRDGRWELRAKVRSGDTGEFPEAF